MKWMRVGGGLVGVAIWICLSIPGALAMVQFDDVSTAAGIDYVGESYGGSWGDRNGDGWPDIFVNHHRNRPGLYVNQGDGTFENRWFEVDVWQTLPFLDQHGAAWADFDNDGDQDLFVSLGATDSSQFLVNEGDALIDRVAEYVFDEFFWSGRLPVWYDYTRDGFLDFSLANRGGVAHTHAQQPAEPPATRFVRQNAIAAHGCDNNQYLQLGDVTGDGSLDLICAGQEAFPQRANKVNQIPFVDITSVFPLVDITVDSVVADFNGDQRTDLFVIGGIQRPSGGAIAGPASDRIEATLAADNDRQRSFRFVSEGDVSIAIHWDARSAEDVFIGASGWTLTPQPADQPLTVTLSSSDPGVHGIRPHDPAVDFGIFIGYDPASQTWSFELSAGGNGHSAYFYVDSTAPVSDLTFEGFTPGETPVRPTLLLNRGNALTDRTLGTGLDVPLSCVAGSAADFDNDMDVDLFLVCRGAVEDLEDMMFENQGDGTFVHVPSTGAEGLSGLGVGIGENVFHADYDVDGFVDLYVTNGLLMLPTGAFDTGGADRLYRNRGNDNNWIQIDLVGTTANRDAVGARVFATTRAPAVKTQLREQDGGYHRWAQDHQRIHFGLAGNDTVDIEVHWPAPSQRVDVFTDVAANALYRVVEGQGIEAVTLPAAVPPSVCGEPTFDKSTEAGVFLWKDCFSGNWFLRVSAGAVPMTTFGGTIVSTAPFGMFEPFSIESSDILDNTSDPAEIVFALEVSESAIDGFDFALAPGAAACVFIDLPAGTSVQVGRLRRPVTAPFDLATTGVCVVGLPVVDVADIVVTEDEPGAQAVFELVLSELSTLDISVDVQVTEQTASAPWDFVMPTTSTVSFSPGQQVASVAVDIVDDLSQEADESFRLELSSPVNAVLARPSATAVIIDDDVSPCGIPPHDPTSEQAIFVWADCATGVWQLRGTAGGLAWTAGGEVVADAPLLSVSSVSLEATDVVDNATAPEVVRFDFDLSGEDLDGFDFTAGSGPLCLVSDDPTLTVFVGGAMVALPTPLDLSTLRPCQ